MKEGWEYKKFEEIMTPAKVVRCGDRDDLPVLSITMRGGIVEQNDRFKKTIASFDRTNYKVVKDGQLVIAFPIDEGLLYTQDVAPEGIMSPAYNIWDVDYSQIDRRFLVAYFHSTFAFAYYKAKLRGSTQRRRSMDKADLLSMPIPVPSLDNQQQIVSELDLLSGVIEKHKAQLEELDKLAQSIFYDMFGDPVTNEKGWEIFKWKQLFNTRLGKMLDRNKQNPEEKKYPYLANANVKWGEFDLTSLKTMTFNNEEVEEFQLLSGDLLICEGGESGRCAIWKEDNSIIKYQKALHRARIKEKSYISPEYTQYYLYFMKKNGALKDYISKATIEHLTGVMLNKLLVLCPPLSLQQEFAAKVEAIEAMKAKVRQSLKEAETLFSERMNYYFG